MVSTYKSYVANGGLQAEGVEVAAVNHDFFCAMEYQAKTDSIDAKDLVHMVEVIFGSRAGIRTALYMAAPVATRFNPVIKVFYMLLLLGEEYMMTISEETIVSTIKKNQFVPFFQPLYDIHTGKCHGVEVLSRLILDNGDVLWPELFLSVVKKNNLMHEMTLELMRKVAKNMAIFEKITSERFIIAINMASSLLSDERFIRASLNMNELCKMHNCQFELELTEHEQFQPLLHVEPMKLLNKADINIILDDFGTGYSGLSHLHQFCFQGLKIPREILFDLPDNMLSKL
ncbi:EAL domain-containing protein, partial [Salmonella enterica]|nr:EAL domain-containing protein [Salmonella enterica]